MDVVVEAREFVLECAEEEGVDSGHLRFQKDLMSAYIPILKKEKT